MNNHACIPCMIPHGTKAIFAQRCLLAVQMPRVCRDGRPLAITLQDPARSEYSEYYFKLDRKVPPPSQARTSKTTPGTPWQEAEAAGGKEAAGKGQLAKEAKRSREARAERRRGRRKKQGTKKTRTKRPGAEPRKANVHLGLMKPFPAEGTVPPINVPGRVPSLTQAACPRSGPGCKRAVEHL